MIHLESIEHDIKISTSIFCIHIKYTQYAFSNSLNLFLYKAYLEYEYNYNAKSIAIEKSLLNKVSSGTWVCFNFDRYNIPYAPECIITSKIKCLVQRPIHFMD